MLMIYLMKVLSEVGELPSDKNLYAEELEDEYDIFDNETNITVESLK